MRKIIVLGLGALSTLTLALGGASPAEAVIVPPGSITDQVCNALPAGLGGVVNLQTSNATQLGLDSTALANATTDLGNKTTDLVDAIVAHIQTVDAGGNVSATSAVVSARASAYGDSAAVWTALSKAVSAGLLQAQVLGMQINVLSSVGAGLC